MSLWSPAFLSVVGLSLPPAPEESCVASPALLPPWEGRLQGVGGGREQVNTLVWSFIFLRVTVLPQRCFAIRPDSQPTMQVLSFLLAALVLGTHSDSDSDRDRGQRQRIFFNGIKAGQPTLP